ncbi:MAG: hypothetical protein ACYCW6_29520, partial [Candidatus Xenobia bacterium]
MAVILMATVMTSALISTGLIHLFLSSRDNSRQVAQDLADSAIAQTVDILMATPTFGATAVASVTATFPSAPIGAQGVVTFQPVTSGPSNGSQPVSINNLQGTTQLQNGWRGRMVAGYCADIMAIGTCGGETRIREMVLGAPSFPYCVAASGPVTATQTLVAGLSGNDLNPSGQPTAMVDTGNVGDLGPGDVLSENTAAAAVTLDSTSTVMGNVEAGGGVQPNGAKIKGEVRQDLGTGSSGNPALPLPLIDVQGKIQQLSLMANPAGNGLASGPPRGNPTTIDTFYFYKGTLDVPGDLVL